jgi:hypothetical protein
MHLGPFLAVAAIVVITPGVDMALVTRNALMHGRRAAVMTAFGINVGILFWVLAAALGLAAVVSTSTTAFAAIKLAGAAYLVYLGVQALRSARTDRPESEPIRRTARQANDRGHQRACTGWARHTPRARKALERWHDDRTDPSTADAQPTRTRMRLRPRLLVQAYRSGACREVVAPRPLLRSPSQESRPRRMEANSWPRGSRRVETATARGMSPSVRASALAGGRGALLPGAGGRASSAALRDRRPAVWPGGVRVLLPPAQ